MNFNFLKSNQDELSKQIITESQSISYKFQSLVLALYILYVSITKDNDISKLFLMFIIVTIFEASVDMIIRRKYISSTNDDFIPSYPKLFLRSLIIVILFTVIAFIIVL